MTDLDTRSPFIHEPAPGNPGWMTWDMRDRERYNSFLGNIIVKPAENGVARIRMLPERKHSNLGNAVHGGATLGFIDISLFAGSRMLGVDFGERGVTVELSTQFTGPGKLDVPLEARVELVRQTRTLVFLRGTIMQQDGGKEEMVASYSGIIKTARKKA